MKKTLTLTIVSAMLAFGASAAMAQGPYPNAMTDGTFGPSGSVTPFVSGETVQVYSAINQLLGTSYTNNAQVDGLEYSGPTDVWTQNNAGGYAVIGLGAGGANSLEVYNSATPNSLINPLGATFTGNQFLGDGSIGNPYIGTSSIFAPGVQFGFALNNTAPGSLTTQTWYSNAALNSDGYTHMLAYNLSSLIGTQLYVYDPNTNTEQLVTLQNPSLLAFEDSSEAPGGTSDLDYNDLVMLVDGVSPVPEPSTWALLAFGLFAAAGVFAFRRKFAVVA